MTDDLKMYTFIDSFMGAKECLNLSETTQNAVYSKRPSKTAMCLPRYLYGA